MEISINGKSADITLESERTVGEVLSGIDHWLKDSGFRLNGLEIDGEAVDSRSVPLVFGRELAQVRALDVKVCAGCDLALDALSDAGALLAAYDDALDRRDRGEAERITGLWDGGAAASFLQVEFPGLFQDLDAAFRNAGTHPEAIKKVLEEQMRELADPLEETERLAPLVESVAARLEELPLDIQTGKDGRAAETAALFSAAAEKLLRLHHIRKIRGEDFSGLEIESVPLDDFLEDFNGAVKEMLAAWQGRDLVLVGDLAEYELAPRLKNLLGALLSRKDPT